MTQGAGVHEQRSLDWLPPEGHPFAAPPGPAMAFFEAGSTETLERANWLVYSSNHGKQTVHLTDRDLCVGDQQIALDDVTDVAFWSPKPRHYEVLAVGEGHEVRARFESGRIAKADLHRNDYIEIVRLLESRCFPRLLQARLVRIDTGLTVRIGSLELRHKGLSVASRFRKRHISWADFDHVVLMPQSLTVMARAGNGRSRKFARVRLSETNAVLLPALLTISAKTFTSHV